MSKCRSFSAHAARALAVRVAETAGAFVFRNSDVMPFGGGMLGDLRAWARKVGLLRGQRNRGIE